MQALFGHFWIIVGRTGFFGRFIGKYGHISIINGFKWPKYEAEIGKDLAMKFVSLEKDQHQNLRMFTPVSVSLAKCIQPG